MAIFLAEEAASRKSGPPDEAAVPALLEAAANGSVQEAERVLDAHPGIINARGGRGHGTALHAAAVGGHLAVAELLLQRGADPTIRDVGDYATALHWAAERGSLPLVKLLVEAGADVIGYGDLHDWTVLGWAMSWKTRPELARYLLEQGAEHTLFTAIALGDLNAIRALATPESINKPLVVFERGLRPLHMAVLRNQPEAATLLLQLGADPQIPDLDGLTPLDYAALRQWKELSQLMIDAGAELRLPAAVALGRSDVVRRALAADPDAFRPTGRWGNLIVRASGFATADVINALLDHGASVGVRVDGRTPLHVAAWDDNVDAIQALVAHGAPLDARDDEHGGTPLGFAEHNGNHAAAAMLRELGAVH
jgi:ankyrin repeat protein